MRSQHGVSKKSGNPYGIVEVVTLEAGQQHGRQVQMFCVPMVAESSDVFKCFDEVIPIFEQRMTGQGPRAELIRLDPVK